ncbi:MAG: ABC-type Zn uptake system ZnuABC Zn-binding protein ZnuA [Paraglaciecola sp.]|jgi:ABC-type Zn uptake system ZnuABC Zn-binding protein ZnuA
MKKIFSTLFFATLTTLIFADPPKKLVVATASIFADMAENIAGGHVDVKTVVPIGSDPHLYKPRPSDAKMLADADLILRNELTFEGWLKKLIENSNTKGKIVTITEGIKPVKSLIYENSTDPHAWMDASNGLIYIENIKNALVEIDPDNKEVYEINYGVYKQQLEDLDTYILKAVRNIPANQRILITSHDAFQYYGRRYGIQLESIMGVSTEAEAQTSDIRRLNKVIRENNVPAVFIESTINPKMLQQLAKDNKVQIGGELFADSIGEKDSAAPSYYDMLKYNTDVIVKALSRVVEPVKATEKVVEEEGSSLLILGLVGALFVGAFFFVAKKMNG